MTHASLLRSTVLFAFMPLIVATMVRPALAQDDGCPPEDELKLHYTLYFEPFKSQNYEDALPELHWMLQNCPGFPVNDDRNFERAVESYEALAEQADEADVKRAYLDSALVMFDFAIPTLQRVGAEVDEFQWTRDKGRFIQNHLDDLSDLEDEIVKSYKKTYDLDPHRIQPYYIEYILNDWASDSRFDEMLDLLEDLMDKRGEEPDIQELEKKYLDRIPDEEKLSFLEAKYAADPTDPDVTNQLATIYTKLGLHDKLREMEPTPGILRVLMNQAILDEDLAGAAAYLDQLQEMDSSAVSTDDYYNLGIAYQSASTFSTAKRYYDRALALDAEYDQARLAVANLYATAVSKCTVTDRKDKAVFWLLSDTFQRIGEAETAASYRRYFPSKEDVHFVPEWTAGATTTVTYTCRGLTISGSTTIRTSN
ncbi:MAG TPA: hypothetical protein VKP65_12335 [Rhodothermales bacterium]|nr:hypothetical protein [Rhodothermales bacterium]